MKDYLLKLKHFSYEDFCLQPVFEFPFYPRKNIYNPFRENQIPGKFR